MDSNALKYNLLNSFEKKEVNDFIDFLFSKKKSSKKPQLSDYKNKILSVSTWNEEDIKVFEENNKQFNQWRPTTW
jgi:hypothetical protein